MTACRICSTDFVQRNSLHAVCSVRCALKIAPISRRKERDEKRDTKRKLEALKTRSEWMKDAEGAFNAWVRRRDEKLPCVSCGGTTGQRHAGHFFSVGARPELRFNADNVHGQCAQCNTYLHGNLLMYRIELLRRIGHSRLESLEGPHPPLKYGTADLKSLRDDYRARVRAME